LIRKKIAIIGGAFDPPTQGHKEMATFVLYNTDMDEVWFVPAYKHKYEKKMTDYDHRLNMCKIISASEGGLKAIDIEKKYDLSGTAYDLLTFLHEHCSHDFYFVVGQDNVDLEEKWVNGKELVEKFKFIVLPRKGVESDPKYDWYKKEPHIYFEGPIPIREISSTKAREMIKENDKSLSFYVSPEVLLYINRDSLYDIAEPIWQVSYYLKKGDKIQLLSEDVVEVVDPNYDSPTFVVRTQDNYKYSIPFGVIKGIIEAEGIADLQKEEVKNG
jgi:nicotinate-nucleotide adenylyltransferase